MTLELWYACPLSVLPHEPPEDGTGGFAVRVLGQEERAAHREQLLLVSQQSLCRLPATFQPLDDEMPILHIRGGECQRLAHTQPVVKCDTRT